MPPIIYQTNAVDRTAEQTATEFAQKYFDEPRTVENFKTIDEYYYTFNLTNGVATYVVEHRPGVRLVSFPLWQIYKRSY